MRNLLWKISNETKIIGNNTYVFCVCSCGSEAWVRKSSLMRDSFSCKKCSNAQRSHQATDTRLYHIWSAMKQRCYYKKSISYRTYGAIGIVVCNAWKNDFSKFQKWALANGYGDDLSIDRVRSTGNYEPSNCRWATNKEQNRNTKRCVWFEKDGKRMVLKDWCSELGVNYGSVRTRISSGMSISDALYKPFKRNGL